MAPAAVVEPTLFLVAEIWSGRATALIARKEIPPPEIAGFDFEKTFIRREKFASTGGNRAHSLGDYHPTRENRIVAAKNEVAGHSARPQ